MTKTTFLLSGFLLLSAFYLKAQTTINVPLDYPTIQSALFAAEWNTTIEVDAGTYTGPFIWPGTLTDVRLIGAGSEVTFLDGDNFSNVIYLERDPELGNEGNTSIEGFTIQNSQGSALHIDGASPYLSDLVFNNNVGEYGGAIYLNNYHGVIENCTFNSNEGYQGGAIYAEQFSGTIQFCNFLSNRAVTYGGALLILSEDDTFIHDCSFENNLIEANFTTGREGGAIMLGEADNSIDPTNEINIINIEITACDFINNQIRENGSGAAIKIADDFYRVKIDSCSFINNEILDIEENVSRGSGAAISTGTNKLNITNSIFEENKSKNGACISIVVESMVNGPQSDIILNSCSMKGNVSEVGSILNFDFGVNTGVVFKNCTMQDNAGISMFAKGIIIGNYSAFFKEITLEHCTVVNNNGYFDLELTKFMVTNSIFWNNDEREFLSMGSDFDVNNCIIKGGGIGATNIDADPLFIDGTLVPSENSPCISAGSSEITELFDFNGNIRPMPAGSLPDIGAYEVEFGIVATEELALIEIGIFPNPSQEFIFFDQQVDQVIIFSKEGKQLMMSKNTQSISLEGFVAGTYIIELYVNEKRSIQKLIKL